MMPLFSILVPTRNRAETLMHTLKTCIAQVFNDYEIVVSDNASDDMRSLRLENPTVREVAVNLKYVRSDVPLSMSANWNLAAENATGEYVIVLGDDDGLMPYALAELARLIRETGVHAVKWLPASYTWPSFVRPEEANYLSI